MLGIWRVKEIRINWMTSLAQDRGISILGNFGSVLRTIQGSREVPSIFIYVTGNMTIELVITHPRDEQSISIVQSLCNLLFWDQTKMSFLSPWSTRHSFHLLALTPEIAKVLCIATTSIIQSKNRPSGTVGRLRYVAAPFPVQSEEMRMPHLRSVKPCVSFQ